MLVHLMAKNVSKFIEGDQQKNVFAFKLVQELLLTRIVELYKKGVPMKSFHHVLLKASLLSLTVLLSAQPSWSVSFSRSNACKNFPGGDLDGDSLLVLLNKEPDRKLKADWQPTDLKNIPGSLTYPANKGIQLRKEALDQYLKMTEQMKKDQAGQILVMSAFRTFEYQCGNLNSAISKYVSGARAVKNGKITPEIRAAAGQIGEQYLADLKSGKMSPEQIGNEVARNFVAEPGRSQHQLGTTFDIVIPSVKNAKGNPVLAFAMEKTKEYKWLAQNAHRFGFALSYPNPKKSQAELDRDKSRYNEETGYYSEPWHWRYIGVEAATEHKQSGLTLDAYLLAKERE